MNYVIFLKTFPDTPSLSRFVVLRHLLAYPSLPLRPVDIIYEWGNEIGIEIYLPSIDPTLGRQFLMILRLVV